MKKLLIILSAIVFLNGCSDIDNVKSGVMDFDQTITVGEALDNWKSCRKTHWEEFETDNGVKVVEFSCEHKVNDYFDKVKKLLSKENQSDADVLDVVSNTQIFQFTINKDLTFQIDNVQVKTVWKDGKFFEDSQKPIKQLADAYKNKMNFDPSEINDNVSVKDLLYIFGVLKSRAE